MPTLANNTIKERIHELITFSFRDLILCLGGIFLIHQLDEDLVKVITMAVEQIYEETVEHLNKLKLPHNGKKTHYKEEFLKPHPEIERFLTKLAANSKKHSLQGRN